MFDQKLAEQVFERVQKFSGSKDVEVIVNSVHFSLTRFANNTIHQNVAEDNNVVSVRTVIDGKTARATTNKTDDTSLKRAVESAEQLPFKFFIQHIGTPNESFSPKKFDETMTAIEHLRAFAKPLGVRVLLENIPNELSSPDRLVEFIRVSHLDDVGICFDTGHAHMMADVPSAFETLKDHIQSTHIHDNKKDKDAHLWPGDGTIDWKQTLDLLAQAPHKPPLLLEIEENEKINPVEKMAEIFGNLVSA